MFQEVADLRDEGSSLRAQLSELSAGQWAQSTPFKQWTVWDVVAHLHLSDQWALAALQGRDAFTSAAAPVLSALRQGTTLAAFTRAHFSGSPGAAILPAWSACFDLMIDSIQTRGESAQRWMAIAQCFAGQPEDPPAPGTRISRS